MSITRARHGNVFFYIKVGGTVRGGKVLQYMYPTAELALAFSSACYISSNSIVRCIFSARSWPLFSPLYLFSLSQRGIETVVKISPKIPWCLELSGFQFAKRFDRIETRRFDHHGFRVSVSVLLRSLLSIYCRGSLWIWSTRGFHCSRCGSIIFSCS